MTYQLIRSNRRTMAIEVRSGAVIVRAPFAVEQAQIDAFVSSREQWIAAHLAKQEEAMRSRSSVQKLSADEIRALAEQACRIIPPRVAYYAKKLSVTYGRITIRNQKTRWGSCSAQGNLNFNCLLMLAPPEVLDSVVVHELCHRKEMNHSKQFYREVLRVFPEYRKWQKWLKENGGNLLCRMTG